VSDRLIEGFATQAGTHAFQRRHADRAAVGHFRQLAGLSLSSIGIGTYLGRDDREADEQYAEAVASALERGINVIDTAINYRSQLSERAVGTALRKAIIEDGWIGREEIVVATKGGFLPFDGGRPTNARAYFDESYVSKGVFRWDEVVGGCHCMGPRYIRDQIERSRKNLGLATIDIYYLHNPETQLDEIPRYEFVKRLRSAFRALEDAVAEERIRYYGTATWNGYRQPASDPAYLSFAELLDLAREVGGEQHHFRVIQLPYNLAMTEALTLANQRDGAGRMVSTLEAVHDRAYVMTSASVMQGRLTQRLPAATRDAFVGLETDAQRALQFARSSASVGTALVGMKQTEHVHENARVSAVPPASADAIQAVLQRPCG
jgi:aryl-alcohol dehydrogenase-like predicted oxidoreductase